MLRKGLLLRQVLGILWRDWVVSVRYVGTEGGRPRSALLLSWRLWAADAEVVVRGDEA